MVAKQGSRRRPRAKNATGRRQAEEALRESEARFREMAETVSSAFWVSEFDNTGHLRYVYMSPAFERIFGIPVERIYDDPRAWLKMIHPDDSERFFAAQKRRAAGEYVDAPDIRIVKPDGTVRWIRTSLSPVKGDDGKILRYVGIADDITERKRAEEKLRESEERFRAVQDNSLDRFTILKPFYDDGGEIVDFTYVYQNARAARTTGFKPEELVGRRMTEVFPTFPRTRFFAMYKQAVETGHVMEFEDCYHADGVDDWFSVRITPIPDGIAIATQIITERKRAEAALDASDRKYRALFDNQTAGLAYCQTVFDDDGRPVDYVLLDVNQAYERNVGYRREQLVGKKVTEAFPGVSQDLIDRHNHVAMTGQSIHFETDVPTLGMWFDVTVFCPERGYFVAISYNITERKQAEEERERLARSIDGQRRQLQAVMDAIPAGVVFADATGKLVQVNEYEKKIWGGSIPLSDNWMEYGVFKGWWHDTGKPLTADDWGMTRALTKGETVMGEVVDIERFDGTRGTKLQCSAPVKDAQGNITSAVTIDIDITDRIKLEKDLKETKLQAELYLDLMGHDINNMNHSAMGYLELALDTLEADGKIGLDGKLLIEKPMQAIDNSSKLIANVRKLQLLMTEGVQTRPIDLHDLFDELGAHDFHHSDKDVTINFGHVEHCQVEGNELLKDVFYNLVSNAVKHSKPDKPVTVDVSVERVDADGRAYYRCAIEDDGPGIPDELKSKLFHRFQRGKTKAHGKGLGLYLVRTMVDGYHGQVWVEDRVPGDHAKGARFVVLLPAVDK